MNRLRSLLLLVAGACALAPATFVAAQGPGAAKPAETKAVDGAPAPAPAPAKSEPRKDETPKHGPPKSDPPTLQPVRDAAPAPAPDKDAPRDPPKEVDVPNALPAKPEARAKPASAEQAEKVSLDEIRRFVSVFRAVKQAYVDPIDDEQLMRAAIRGLLADLDPHSGYLDKTESAALNEQASGAYEGLGLEVLQQPDRTLLVIAPIDDTPAARAGIRPGDVITQIDGKPIEADNVDGAVDSMRGVPGTTITLTVERENSAEPLKFALQRETIRVSSVRVRVLEPGYAYLRISTFQSDTGVEVEKKLKALQRDTTLPLQGLVMDLRSNPGGLLNSAVEVADAFLDRGTIVSTKGRLGYSNAEHVAHRGDLLAGAPIVILSDSGTASAAEVLAGALRDHRRALVMGTASFGKGSVQTVLPLDNGDSIKLTTARYYTPSGASIQASGIAPDVELPEDAELAAARDRPPTLRERDLPGHLRGDREGAAVPVVQPPAEELGDFAVREALNLLKGLAVFRKSGTRDG
jgi:carboxyl-terminal processing protease